MTPLEDELEGCTADMKSLLAALDVAGDIIKFRKLGLTDLEIGMYLQQEMSDQSCYIATKHSVRH